jgi:hypothetical protein
MISRETYTKIFLKEAGKSIDKATVKLHVDKWFHSRRTKRYGGLKLTDEGLEFLMRDLNLQPHEVPFLEPIELSPQIIIFFDQYLESPYYLTHKSLTVFSEKEAFKLHMFSDDIRKFGLVKAMNSRKSEDQLDEIE